MLKLFFSLDSDFDNSTDTVIALEDSQGPLLGAPSLGLEKFLVGLGIDADVELGRSSEAFENFCDRFLS